MPGFTSVSVPNSIEDVSKEWLSKALATTSDIRSIEYERIGEDYGFASKLYRITLSPKEKLQTVVLKLWDTSSQAGLGELLFYQNLQDIPIRIPECFNAGFDSESARAFLLLEDIQDSVQGDVLSQVNIDLAKAIASDLAKLHSNYLEHPRLNSFDWISSVSVWKLNAEWFNTRHTLFLERFPNKLSGVALSLFDVMEQAPELVNQVLKDIPQTLLHGDFHLDNMLFEEGAKAVFIDWSRPLKGPASYNLAELLFQMTSLDNFDEVLATYLLEFNQQSNSDLKLEQLENQLTAEVLRLFTRTTFGIARWQPDSERGVQIIEHDLNNAIKIIEFWCRRNPDFFPL